MMAHVNPAHWIARIMITWSIVTCCMAAISKPWHFYLLRFLLVRERDMLLVKKVFTLKLFRDCLKQAFGQV